METKSVILKTQVYETEVKLNNFLHLRLFIDRFLNTKSLSFFIQVLKSFPFLK